MSVSANIVFVPGPNKKGRVQHNRVSIKGHQQRSYWSDYVYSVGVMLICRVKGHS